MTVERTHIGWKFWLQWVLASTVGWPFGVLLGMFGAYAVADPPCEDRVLGVVSGAMLAALAGAVVGIMQWLVLRRQVSRAG